jgi:hypothetical protein
MPGTGLPYPLNSIGRLDTDIYTLDNNMGARLYATCPDAEHAEWVSWAIAKGLNVPESQFSDLSQLNIVQEGA